MNTLDVMKYGHLTVLGAVDGLDDEAWQGGGVCGTWSVKDIIAHLTSYELLLADVLHSLVHQCTARNLDHFLRSGPAFNDAEVEARQGRTVRDVRDEYGNAYGAVSAIASKVSPLLWRKNGTLPWYGQEYSLDDWIVYQFYGHKREHLAQIAVYCDGLARNAPDGQQPD